MNNKKTFLLLLPAALLFAGGFLYADTLNVPEDYATIGEAIDAATPGQTICVDAGTYTENLVIAKSLNLIGAGSATTVIDGNNVGNAVTITASDVSVSGFRVTGGWANGGNVFTPYGGIVIDPDGLIVLAEYHVGSALTGIIIENNSIDNNAGNGVYVSSAGDGGAADNIVIRNNRIYNNGAGGYAGISLTHPNYLVRDVWDIADWRRPKNILVEENTVYDNSEYGVYVSAGKDIVIRTNSISGNVKYGLQLASGWNRPDMPCEYTTVENNEIYDNARNGIKLTSWNRRNSFTGNNIHNNGYGYTGGSKHYNYGFLFQDGNDNTIQNNTIAGNALGGLYLWGNGDPSYTWYSTINNVITGNTISNHSEQGIYIPVLRGYPNSGFKNSRISCNNIVNNLAYGLENADATQNVMAKYNWWGHETGPSGGYADPETGTIADGSGDAVSANVRFDPWLEKQYWPIVMKEVPGVDGGGIETDFQIGRDEVTVENYLEFLNAAEQSGDIVVTEGEVMDSAGTLYCLTTDANANAPIEYDIPAASGSRFAAVGDRVLHPVMFVSWFGSAAFCNWRSGLQGLDAVYDPAAGWTADLGSSGFRLPTEAEWYKAAAWNVGDGVFREYGIDADSVTDQDANFLNSGDDYETDAVRACPVGSYEAASPYGLKDASGNVWEWCHDFYDEDGADPDVDAHAVRGGSWGNLVTDVTTSSRCGNKPEQVLNSVGFRIVTMPGE